MEEKKSNIIIKRCILINAKEKRKKIPINLNSKSISNQFKSSNHVNLVASSYLSMGQKINISKNQKKPNTNLTNIINNIVNYSYNKHHKLYNNSLNEESKNNSSVKNNICKPYKYINLSNIRKKNLSSIPSYKVISNNYSNSSNNNSKLKNNKIKKHDFLDSRNKTRKLLIKSKIKEIKNFQKNKPKSVSPSNNVISNKKLRYRNEFSNFNKKQQSHNTYNYKNKIINDGIKNKLSKEKANSIKKLFIKIKSVKEINERKNRNSMFIKSNTKKKLTVKSKIENSNQNFSYKSNKIPFPDNSKNTRKLLKVIENHKNINFDISKIIKKINKNSTDNTETNSRINNISINSKKIVSALRNSIIKIKILENKNKNRTNNTNYNNQKIIKGSKIPFINNIIISNIKENNERERSKNNEKEKEKKMQLKKISNENMKNKKNNEENLSMSNLHNNNYSSDGIVVDNPEMEHKICSLKPIEYLNQENNNNNINKEKKEISNNRIIIENNLFNEENLNEIPYDYDEQFDDLYSIINKMDFKNVLICTKGIFYQEGRSYIKYKDIFDKEFDKLFSKKRGSLSNNNKIKIGGERGYISNAKTNYSSSDKKMVKPNSAYKENLNIVDNLIIK